MSGPSQSRALGQAPPAHHLTCSTTAAMRGTVCHWERNGLITLSCAVWVMTELLMEDNGVLHLNLLRC